MNRYKAYVFIGIISVSLSPILIKATTAQPITIAFFRLLFTVLILSAISTSKLHTLKVIQRKDLMWSLVSGFVLAFHFYAWIASLQLTNIASATVLVNVHPIAILFLSYWVLHEKITAQKVMAVLLTLIGSIVLSYRDFSLDPAYLTGDLLAVGSALLFACYLIIGRLTRQGMTNFQYTYVVYFACMVTLGFIGLLTSPGVFIVTGLNNWLLFIAMAIIPTLLGHSLFNKALEGVSPTFISLAVLGEPILASLWAWIIFAEEIIGFQWLGIALCLLGIVWYTLQKPRKQPLSKSIGA